MEEPKTDGERTAGPKICRRCRHDEKRQLNRDERVEATWLCPDCEAALQAMADLAHAQQETVRKAFQWAEDSRRDADEP